MKKFVVVLTTTVLLFSFSSCGTKTETEHQTTPSPAAVVTSFLELSIDNKTSLEEYLTLAGKYLNDAALSSAENQLASTPNVMFKCEDITIKKVTNPTPTTARVTAAYTMVILDDSGSQELNKEVTFDLILTDNTWEIIK